MQLLYFHEKHCAPCARMQETAQAYAEQTGVPLYVFDAGDWYGGNDVARRHHVRVLPCLILTADDETELARTEAVHTVETLHQAFDPYLGNPPAPVKGGESGE